jgi:hypothetical protein
MVQRGRALEDSKSRRPHIGYSSVICIKFRWCQRGRARKASISEPSSHWKLISQCGQSHWKTYAGLARKSTNSVEKVNGASIAACGAIHYTCASIGWTCAGSPRKLAGSVEKVNDASIVACEAIYCTFDSIDCKTCTDLARRWTWHDLACSHQPKTEPLVEAGLRIREKISRPKDPPA